MGTQLKKATTMPTRPCSHSLVHLLLAVRPCVFCMHVRTHVPVWALLQHMPVCSMYQCAITFSCFPRLLPAHACLSLSTVLMLYSAANLAAMIGTNYYYGSGYVTNVVKGIDATYPDGMIHRPPPSPPSPSRCSLERRLHTFCTMDLSEGVRTALNNPLPPCTCLYPQIQALSLWSTSRSLKPSMTSRV